MKNKSNDYYFEVLGVTHYSTKIVIKRAFRDLIKKWHPDKFPNDDNAWVEATEKSKLIIEAYEILKDYEPQITENEKTYSSTRTRVQSSNIHSVGYDIEKNILQIAFLNGSIYEYYDVPVVIFEEFMNATSKGKYANRNIFYSYRYTRIN